MLFKTTRHPRDNDLIQAEARTLRHLHGSVNERWHPFLPVYVDHVEVRTAGGVRRRANVLEALDGFYTLKEVMEAYPFGIDPRDMAWMWRRLLAILGAVHQAGRVHGAVFPDHVMVHPEKHGLALIDWSYAGEQGQRPRAVSRAYRSWYPPEVTGGRRLSASADIYTGAQTALALLGPRVADLPVPLRAFFRACKLDARLRPDDAWDLQSAFNDVLERCYGRRRFRPFHMPASDREAR
jgi:serine/threonine protein kinase